LNQNSGATREAIFNPYVDGAYIGNGSRQFTLTNNQYAGGHGSATITGLSAAAHTFQLQARGSIAAAVAASDGSLVVSAR
jgi:hypothetical protein